MTAKVFRVCISENPEKYPQTVFIDFGLSDSFNTHAVMFAIRRETYPDLKCLSDGLLMYDFGNGNIRFRMENIDNGRPNDYETKLLERFREPILTAYAKMRAQGRVSTLDAGTKNVAGLCADILVRQNENEPMSARERYLLDEAREYERKQERLKELRTRTKRHSYENGYYD